MLYFCCTFVSGLESLTETDKFVRPHSNVLLALHLLEEQARGDRSFWRDYIALLPKQYSNVLYFDSDDMRLMQKSAAYVQAVKLFRDICRQYAYFALQMYSSSDNRSDLRKLHCARNFTFDAYR